ncbi:hypothetical protein NC796_14235 [Aliifodinibius sp. S!AR15-10]|uniref:antibiotic biosynthesis monooxygenase family protein n=1 Tax=Aliifodinibius sp. S!AR15-10 TaxID=2950437 RepID=UPI002854AAB3|nr:hypothetical protein [Aliifodinibius sp. S!AR15-10]MDR8392308.1 hypothetical protein [Aliifodinibius sp. S!AR15-10]
MIIVQVQHFLNKAGQGYFPQWVEKLSKKLQRYNGFVSICVLESLESSDECHLQLTFENEDSLLEWANSVDHDNLIAELKPYRKQKQVSSIFRVTDEFYRVD